MQKRKIFIEIDLPEKVKKLLSNRTEKWADLPIKWSKPENLHITLAFLGYVDETMLPEICQSVSEATEHIDAFDIEFDRIELGPNPENPKMVWLSGNPSEELKDLHEKIEKSLSIFIAEKKEFRPHITLGRIRKHKWEELEEKPNISEQIRILIPVESVHVMESGSESGGKEYSVIEHCPLS